MSEARRHRAEDSPPNRTTAHVPAPRRSGDAPTATIRALPQHRRSPMARRVLAVLGLLVLLSLILVAVFDWRLSSTFTRSDGAFDGVDQPPPANVGPSVTMLMLESDFGPAQSSTLP